MRRAGKVSIHCPENLYVEKIGYCNGLQSIHYLMLIFPITSALLISSPTQGSVTLQIPFIATYRGISIENSVRIILRLDGVEFLVIGAVEGLLPVHLTWVGLRDGHQVSGHVFYDMRLHWSYTYLAHITARVRCNTRQCWNPFFGHLFRGYRHARKVCAVRPRSKHHLLERDSSCVHGENYDVSMTLIADVLHAGFTELYKSLPTTAEDTFSPILTNTTPSSVIVRIAAVKSSL